MMAGPLIQRRIVWYRVSQMAANHPEWLGVRIEGLSSLPLVVQPVCQKSAQSAAVNFQESRWMPRIRVLTAFLKRMTNTSFKY